MHHVLKNSELSLQEQWATLNCQPPIVKSVSLHPQYHSSIRQGNSALSLVTNMSRLFSMHPHPLCLQNINLSFIGLDDAGLQHLLELLDTNNYK